MQVGGPPLQDDLEQVEESIFDEKPNRETTERIYRLKREVLEFRRAAVPLAAPLKMLHDGSRSPLPQKEVRLLFRDVADHLLRVIDHVESYDRLLTDILNAHLAQITVQQNSDMRKISAWVAIAAVPTMIAGIYGMNFEHMPELKWHYGYFIVLGVMALYYAFDQATVATGRCSLHRALGPIGGLVALALVIVGFVLAPLLSTLLEPSAGSASVLMAALGSAPGANQVQR